MLFRPIEMLSGGKKEKNVLTDIASICLLINGRQFARKLLLDPEAFARAV